MQFEDCFVLFRHAESFFNVSSTCCRTLCTRLVLQPLENNQTNEEASVRIKRDENFRYKVDTYYLLSGMLYIIFLLPYKYYIKLQSITESNHAHRLANALISTQTSAHTRARHAYTREKSRSLTPVNVITEFADEIGKPSSNSNTQIRRHYS